MNSSVFIRSDISRVWILENVPHRQFVFTIPKRFRLYFRYNRTLLGKLRRAAWETVKEVYQVVLNVEDAIPVMVETIQSFGSLMNWNSHIHAIISDGAFRRDGTFIPLTKTAVTSNCSQHCIHFFL